MQSPISPDELRIVPANQATWHDLEAIFGTADYPFHCQCQRLKVTGWLWRDTTLDERIAMQRAATACGNPEAEHTSGLVAYLGDEPVGWVAVEPRIAYPKLRGTRVPWTGRSEDKADAGVWAVTCFCVRKGYRGRGITYALAQAAAAHALERGAIAVEGYAMVTEPGVEITWGEVHVGAVQVFEEAGFAQVSAPTKRRRVMRTDFRALAAPRWSTADRVSPRSRRLADACTVSLVRRAKRCTRRGSERIPNRIPIRYAPVMATEQIAVRLPADQLEALDGLVDRGVYASRAAAVRAGVEALVELDRRRRDDSSIVAGYRRRPPTDAETSAAIASLRDAIAEEPW